MYFKIHGIQFEIKIGGPRSTTLFLCYIYLEGIIINKHGSMVPKKNIFTIFFFFFSYN